MVPNFLCNLVSCVYDHKLIQIPQAMKTFYKKRKLSLINPIKTYNMFNTKHKGYTIIQNLIKIAIWLSVISKSQKAAMFWSMSNEW